MIYATSEKDKGGRCQLLKVIWVGESRTAISEDFRRITTELGASLGARVRIDLFPPAARFGKGLEATWVINYPLPCTQQHLQNIHEAVEQVALSAVQ